MVVTEEFTIHVPARKRSYSGSRSEVIRVSGDAYNTLVDIYNESALSIAEVASLLILEASKRVVYDK